MSSWFLKFEYLDELDRQAAMPAHEIAELTESAHRLPAALGLRASEADQARALEVVLRRHQGDVEPHPTPAVPPHASPASKEEGFAGRAGWVRPASPEAHAAELAELDRQLGNRWKKGWGGFNTLVGHLLPGLGFVLALSIWPHDFVRGVTVVLPFFLLGLGMTIYGDVLKNRLKHMRERRHRLTRYAPAPDLTQFQRWAQVQRWNLHAATRDAWNACKASPMGVLNLDVEHLEAWADELEKATKAAREAKLHAQWERLNTGSLTAF